VELLTDDPDRCRTALRGVPREALTVDQGPELLAAVAATLEVGPGPKLADLKATIYRRADAPDEVWHLALDLVRLSTESKKPYWLGIDRHRAGVLQAHQERRVADAVADLDAVRMNGGSVAEILAKADAVKAAATSDLAGGGGRIVTLAGALQEWRSRDRAPVVETGFAPLDRLGDGGLPVGGLTVLAGAPGAGKSALALQATLGALYADPGLRAIWAAGEMGVEAIARRAVVAWAAGPGDRRVNMHGAGSRTAGALEVAEKLEAEVGGRLSILPAPIPLEEIVAAVVATQSRLVVIDYVQLVQAAGAADRRAEVDAVVRALRTLATEREVALLVVSNVAKNVGVDARAGMIGKESSEIDFAADVLLLGIADDQDDDNRRRPVRWRCLKNRHGERRDLETIFDGARQTFTAVVDEVEEFSEFAPAEGRS
jgi:predicted ATP-dependent serine protease